MSHNTFTMTFLNHLFNLKKLSWNSHKTENSFTMLKNSIPQLKKHWIKELAKQYEEPFTNFKKYRFAELLKSPQKIKHKIIWNETYENF